MRRIVVVDPAADDRHGVADLCRLHGHDVVEAATGERAIELTSAGQADLLLTEWVLPDISGTEVVRELRRRGLTIPIVLLTSRSNRTDEVVGFEVGADDYIRKPYDPRVLAARLSALLRRTASSESGAAREGVSRVGGLQIDHSARRVRVGDQEVHLTMTEFNLLDVLASNPERVLTRGQLRDKVWGSPQSLDDHSVDPHVQRLRHKVFGRPACGLSLEAVPGLGYRLSVRPA
ncbi:MAG: response regulator transcription factor [Candidatus Dormibacterales bacterium]